MADMANEAEKQVSWFSKIADKIANLITSRIERIINSLFRRWYELMKKIFKDRVTVVGDRPIDTQQKAELTLDDLKKYDRVLEANGLERSYNFSELNGGVIDPKNFKFRGVNNAFRKAMNTKTHLEIESEKLKQMNSNLGKYENIFKKSLVKLSPEQMEKILSISYQDILDYQNGDRSKIDETLANTIETSGYRMYIQTKDNISALENDLRVSNSLNEVKEAISFENANKVMAFEEKRHVIISRFENMNKNLSLLETQLDLIRSQNSNDKAIITDLQKQIDFINNDPIYKAATDPDILIVSKLQNKAQYDDTITRTSLDEEGKEIQIADISESQLRSLLVEEYNYVADNQYIDKNFKANEIKRNAEYHQNWSKFCEKYHFMPMERKSQNAEVLRQNEKKSYNLDGSVSKCNGKLYDVVSSQTAIISSFNYNREQYTKLINAVDKYNSYQFSTTDKDKSKELEKENTDKEEKTDKEKEIPEDKKGMDELNYEISKAYDTIGEDFLESGNVYGNVSSYAEFKEKCGNDLMIQIEIPPEELDKSLKAFEDMGETGPYIIKKDSLTNTADMTVESPERGSNSDNKDYSITMKFSDYERFTDQLLKKIDGKDVYDLQIDRARMFNDPEMIDERKVMLQLADEKFTGTNDSITCEDKNHSAVLATLATGKAYSDNKDKSVYVVYNKTYIDDSESPSNNNNHKFLLNVYHKDVRHDTDLAQKVDLNMKGLVKDVSPINPYVALSHAKVPFDISKPKQIGIITKTKDGFKAPEINSTYRCLLISNNRTFDVGHRTKLNERGHKVTNEYYYEFELNKNGNISCINDPNLDVDKYLESKNRLCFVPIERINSDGKNDQILDLNPSIGQCLNGTEYNYEEYVQFGFVYQSPEIEKDNTIVENERVKNVMLVDNDKDGFSKEKE